MSERVVLSIGTKKGLFVAEGSKTRGKFTLRGPFGSGVAIYSIGLALSTRDADQRLKLQRLSAETGGQAYFIQNAGELVGVYKEIEAELRTHQHSRGNARDAHALAEEGADEALGQGCAAAAPVAHVPEIRAGEAIGQFDQLGDHFFRARFKLVALGVKQDDLFAFCRGW